MSSRFEVGQMRFLWDLQLEIPFGLVNIMGLKPKGNDRSKLEIKITGLPSY